ncbi:MAG TPA: ABC transporter permease [Chthoniobacterales bacterium]
MRKVFHRSYQLAADLIKSPVRCAVSLYGCRELLLHFIWRDFIGRYRGAHFGALLSLASPIFMLAIYTIVFGYILNVRFSEEHTSKATFALALFSALTFFQLFADAISRAPVLIIENPNFVTKVIFPLEILPFSVVGTAFLHFVVSMGALLAGLLIFEHHLSWSMAFAFLLVIPVLLYAAGCAWILAALGTFFRDIAALLPPLVLALTYLSAIFYPVSAVPERLRPFLYANPFAVISEQAREIMIAGQPLGWVPWASVTLGGALVFMGGYLLFMRTKRYFADSV